MVAALAAAHLGVIVAMLRLPPAIASVPVLPAMAVSAIPLPGDPVEVAPPPAMREIAAEIDLPDYDVADASMAATTAACELTADVETALRRDRNVGLAVARIASSARSVSNALLLWDGAWAQPASIGGKGVLAPIRAAVEAQVRAAPTQCRNEPVIGPRLVVVPDGDRQIVLAFGSGQWSWQKIL